MEHPTNQKHYYDTCRYLHVQTKCVVEMDEDSSGQQASAEVTSCENDLIATKSEDSLHVDAKDEDDQKKKVSGLQSFQVASPFNDKLCFIELAIKLYQEI